MDVAAGSTGDRLARLGKLKDAVEALIHPEDAQRQYVALAGKVDRIFRAVGLDPRVRPFAADRGFLVDVAAALVARRPEVDISAVMESVERLLDASVDAHAYVIREPEGAPYGQGRVDLSAVDFARLARFPPKWPQMGERGRG